MSLSSAAKTRRNLNDKNMRHNIDSVRVRYIVYDVEASIKFYENYLGFTLLINAAPAFAAVKKDGLELLLSGRTSSAGRTMPDGAIPHPGGWNRFQLIVPNLEAEVERLKGGGVVFRNEIISGPGGSQILLMDPSGNAIELFQPA
jgi:predicted enzyme related to lactoylglutathione lyase